MRKLSGALVISLLLVSSSPVLAKTIAVAANQATLLNRPQSEATAVLKVPRYYPLEVKDEKGEFYKVLDYRHRDGWIAKSLISRARSAVVAVNTANVRKGPDTSQAILFKARQGVAFKVAGERGNWLRVVHESGKSGWISKSLLWGF